MSRVRAVPRPPPPSPDDLLDRPVHVTVRDYPEVLGVLRRRGVDPGTGGGAPLRSLEDAEAVAGSLMDVAAWRPWSAGGRQP